MDNNDKYSFEKYEKQIETEFENSTIFNSAEKEETPVEKPKKHTKNAYVKLLAGLLSFAIVISGSIFAVVYLWPTEDEKTTEEDTTSSDTSTINLTSSANVSLKKMNNADKDAISNIKKIYIKNQANELNVVPYKTSDGVSYKILGVQKSIPINDTLVTEFASNVFNVTAKSKLDGKWTPKDCGLDNPKITVKVTMADNSTFTIKVGDKLATGDGYYYVSTSLKDGIYVGETTVYENFSQKLKDLVDTDMITAIEADGDNDSYFSNSTLVKYDKIIVNGQNFENEVELAYKESDQEALIYRVVSPVKTYASDEQISTLISPLKDGLAASSAYVLNPDNKDLKEYGLDDPYLEINYTIKKKNYTLKISKAGVKDNNYCACTINDVPVIYCVSTDVLGFYNWTLDDIRYNLLYLRNIDTIKSLTAEYKGKSYKYNLSFDEVATTTAATVSGQTTTSSSSSDAETELNVIMNSTPIDGDSFKNIYQRIVMTSATKYLKAGESAPSGEPTLKLTMQHVNGKDSEVITYTKYNENYYLFKLNGIGDELIPARKVELLLSNFELLRQGKDVSSPNEQQ